MAVGIATVISEFLPILLALIPFSPAQTWESHRVCAWMTVGFLGYMIAFLPLALLLSGIRTCLWIRRVWPGGFTMSVIRALWTTVVDRGRTGLAVGNSTGLGRWCDFQGESVWVLSVMSVMGVVERT